MQARMSNPATVLPDAMQAINGLVKTAHSSGVPSETLELVHLRASQVNGCSVCVDFGVRGAKLDDDAGRRLFMVAAWRESPFFTEAERAALELAEAVTRLADRPDPVPDDVWTAAAKHYTEEQLAGLVLWIATTNLFNRLNAATKQQAGQPVSWS